MPTGNRLSLVSTIIPNLSLYELFRKVTVLFSYLQEFLGKSYRKSCGLPCFTKLSHVVQERAEGPKPPSPGCCPGLGGSPFTSEESTPTVKSNIRFVVDDFPMFEKPSTRTIGEEDKGKTNILNLSKLADNGNRLSSLPFHPHLMTSTATSIYRGCLVAGDFSQFL